MANTFALKPQAQIGKTEQQVGGYSPANGKIATIIGLSLANSLGASGQNITVSVFVKRGTTKIYILRDALLLVGGAIVAIGGEQKVVLEPGDGIWAVSSADTSLDALMTVLEIG